MSNTLQILNVATIDLTTSAATQTCIVNQDLTNYTYVALQFFWSDLNAADATVKFQETIFEQISFVDVPTLTYTLASTPSSCMLVHKEFACKYVAAYVNKGTCTTGTLTIKALVMTRI